jgi:hypothetical protein
LPEPGGKAHNISKSKKNKTKRTGSTKKKKNKHNSAELHSNTPSNDPANGAAILWAAAEAAAALPAGHRLSRVLYFR